MAEGLEFIQAMILLGVSVRAEFALSATVFLRTPLFGFRWNEERYRAIILWIFLAIFFLCLPLARNSGLYSSCKPIWNLTRSIWYSENVRTVWNRLQSLTKYINRHTYMIIYASVNCINRKTGCFSSFLLMQAILTSKRFRLRKNMEILLAKASGGATRY